MGSKLDWYGETIRLLAFSIRKGKSVHNIAHEAGVTKRWLYMVLDGTIKDPGVKRLYKVWKVVST